MTRFSFAPVAPDLAIDLLYLMGITMRADGKIEAGERKALDAAARALGLGSFTMPTDRPNLFRLDRPNEDRWLLFAAAVWMILADGQVDTKERALFSDLAVRLQIDELQSHRLTKLARESFGVTGADGHARDWSVAFSMLVQAIQSPSDAELG
ncbi:MAG: TerB family tellurite resistance protein [Sandaracinaceae bacterium]|nr:TerB family tellurite resistance protein [Sandaracinaceae bacterium]